MEGREAIKEFRRRKWSRELDYRLKGEMRCHQGNGLAERFEYEAHGRDGQRWRSHGNELGKFDENGLMKRREASINNYKTGERELGLRWPVKASKRALLNTTLTRF